MWLKLWNSWVEGLEEGNWKFIFFLVLGEIDFSLEMLVLLVLFFSGRDNFLVLL